MSTRDDIRRAQMIAGENAVIADLRRKGLVPQAPLSETESLRKDAERYRWLRNWGDDGCTEKDGHGGSQLCTGTTLDERIDKIMSTARPSPAEPA